MPGRILIVDDDVGIRESLAEVLGDEGYEVATAENGRAALEYLRSSAPPCMILLDLMMPVMNGWDFCREKEADSTLSEIPVLVISASPDPRMACKKAAGFFAKPIQLAQLLETVARYC